MSHATARRLAARLPFFYGWVVVGCAMCATFARQGAAVATLSVFIAPMSAEFGWSRTAISGAVSLGAVLGALSAPVLGRLVDRHGARAIAVNNGDCKIAGGVRCWFVFWQRSSSHTYHRVTNKKFFQCCDSLS